MEVDRIILVALVTMFTIAAAVWDLRVKKIPNVLTVPFFAAGLFFHLVTGFIDLGLGGAGQSFLFSMGGFATGFGILLVLWLIGGGGAGDVKFMGALGAWLGAKLILYVFFVGTLLLAFAAIAMLLWHVMRLGIVGTKQRYLTGTSKQRRRLIPYAVPAAIATWIVLIQNEILSS